eukprot:13149548-Ditylum_brightwellii.AAC.1
MSREIFHLQRSNAGATECDAASCYNRMIVGPTSIAETNAGTPEEVSTTFAWVQRKEFWRNVPATATIIQAMEQDRAQRILHQNGISMII